MLFPCGFGAPGIKPVEEMGLVDVPKMCWLEVLRNASPKHSAVIPMFRGFAWWPSDECTFTMEFVADWVRVPWRVSPTRRNRQMRHTAVSQLNSRFSPRGPWTVFGTPQSKDLFREANELSKHKGTKGMGRLDPSQEGSPLPSTTCAMFVRMRGDRGRDQEHQEDDPCRMVRHALWRDLRRQCAQSRGGNVGLLWSFPWMETAGAAPRGPSWQETKRRIGKSNAVASSMCCETAENSCVTRSWATGRSTWSPSLSPKPSKATWVVLTWGRTPGFFGHNQASKSSRKSWRNWSKSPKRTSQWPRTSWKNTPMSTRKGFGRAGSGKRILRKCRPLWLRPGTAPVRPNCKRWRETKSTAWIKRGQRCWTHVFRQQNGKSQTSQIPMRLTTSARSIWPTLMSTNPNELAHLMSGLTVDFGNKEPFQVEGFFYLRQWSSRGRAHPWQSLFVFSGESPVDEDFDRKKLNEFDHFTDFPRLHLLRDSPSRKIVEGSSG